MTTLSESLRRLSDSEVRAILLALPAERLGPIARSLNDEAIFALVHGAQDGGPRVASSPRGGLKAGHPEATTPAEVRHEERGARGRAAASPTASSKLARGGVKTAILAALPGRTKEIARSVGKVQQHVHTTLKRAEQEGLVERDANGVWSLRSDRPRPARPSRAKALEAEEEE